MIQLVVRGLRGYGAIRPQIGLVLIQLVLIIILIKLINVPIIGRNNVFETNNDLCVRAVSRTYIFSYF